MDPESRGVVVDTADGPESVLGSVVGVVKPARDVVVPVDVQVRPGLASHFPTRSAAPLPQVTRSLPHSTNGAR